MPRYMRAQATKSGLGTSNDEDAGDLTVSVLFRTLETRRRSIPPYNASEAAVCPEG